MYGIHEMRERIGLIPLLGQGALYILGAGLYAVSSPIKDSGKMEEVVG